MEYKLISNRDIVLFSFQPWDTALGSNFKDMARELSKSNRILYVNRALDRITLIKDRKNTQVKSRLASIKYAENELVEVQPHLWVQNPRTIVESINWIPFPWLHDQLNKINNKRIALQINKAIKQLGFSNVILINDNDFIRGRYLKQMVNCTDYIFYKRDYMLGVGYFQRHGPRLETGVLKDADIVVTNSAYLQKRAKRYNPNSFDIGQGCYLGNYLMVNNYVPDDIRAIKKPIIGYTGFISAWRIDIEIIVYIAAKFPECNVVLIGPVDELFQMKDIKNLKNIHFLGQKAPELIPAYIQYFDICINPQIVNEITRGNYPRKVDEYLAMGKPVVATETDAMELFKEYTWLCKTKMDFVEKIKEILSNPGLYTSEKEKERRISFAVQHSWTESMDRFREAYYETKSKPPDHARQELPPQKNRNRLQFAAIYLLIAYFLFIYLKFLFY